MVIVDQIHSLAALRMIPFMAEQVTITSGVRIMMIRYMGKAITIGFTGILAMTS